MAKNGDWKKRVGVIALFLSTLLVSSWIGFEQYVQSGGLLRFVEAKVCENVGVPVSIGEIRLAQGPKVIISNFKVESVSHEPFLYVWKLEVSSRWHSILSGRVSKVQISNASMTIRFNERGEFISPIPMDSSSSMIIPRIECLNSRVNVIAPGISSAVVIERLAFSPRLSGGYETIASLKIPDVTGNITTEFFLPSDFNLLKTKAKMEIPLMDMGELARVLGRNVIPKDTPLSGKIALSAELLTHGRMEVYARLDGVACGTISEGVASIRFKNEAFKEGQPARFEVSSDISRMLVNGTLLAHGRQDKIEITGSGEVRPKSATSSYSDFRLNVTPISARLLAQAFLPGEVTKETAIGGTMALAAEGHLYNHEIYSLPGSTSVFRDWSATVCASLSQGRYRSLNKVDADIRVQLTGAKQSPFLMKSETSLKEAFLGKTSLFGGNALALSMSTTLGSLDLQSLRQSVLKIHSSDFDLSPLASLAGFPISGKGSLDVNDWRLDDESNLWNGTASVTLSDVVCASTSLKEIRVLLPLQHEISSGRILIKRGSVSSEILCASCEAELNVSPSKPMRGEIRMEDLSIESFAPALDALGFSVSGLKGKVRPVISFKFNSQGINSDISVKAGVKSAEGSALDDRLIWSGVDGSLDLRLSQESQQSTKKITASVDLNKGEILYDTLYHNLEAAPLELSAELRAGRDSSIEIDDAKILIPKALEVLLSGSVHTKGVPRIDVKTTGKITLNRFLSFVASGWFSAGTNPFKDAEADGEVNFTSAITDKGDHKIISGKLECAVKSIYLPQYKNIRIDGLSMDLPFALSLGKASQVGQTQETTGELKIDKMILQQISIESLLIPISLRGNRLNIARPVSVALFGGQFELDSFEMEDILDIRSRIYAKGRLDRLSMASLSPIAGLPAMEGTLSCDTAEIRSESGNMKILAPLTIAVFGGTVRAKDTEWADYLSRYSTLKMSFDLHGLDLKKMSSQFPIGQISGVINGKVDNLALQAGFPVGFDVEIQTDPDAGGDQQISSDAIRTMLVVDQNSLSEKTFLELLERRDSFAYSQIGFRATLKKNLFRVEGTVQKGGGTYVMLGAGFEPLNIVFHVGENGTLFREYVELMKTQLDNVKKSQFEIRR